MRSHAVLGTVAMLALFAAPAAAADGIAGGMRAAPPPAPAARPAPAMGGPRGGWGQGGWHPGGPRPAPGGWHGGGWNGGHGHWGGHGGWTGGYHRPFRGWRMPRFWLAPGFYVPNYAYYGLPAPGYGRNWIRYYDDAVLVGGDGVVVDTVPGVDWDGYDRGPDAYYDGPAGGYGYEDFGPDYDDRVTWGGRYVSGPTVYQVPPGGTTTIIIQTQPVTTTTRTVVEERTVYVKRPVRKWRPRARLCACSR